MANRGRRTSRVRRFLKLFAIGTVSFIVIGLVALWLAFQRIPDWYRPVALTEAVAQEAQRSFTNFTDTVSDRIVEGEPFDVTIEQEAVNTWLAAAPELWPERRRVSPERLRDPAVAFEPGRIRIGAHINHNGWETIAGAVLDIEVCDDDRSIRIRLRSVHGGAIEVPHSVLEDVIDPLLRKSKQRATRSADNLEMLENMLRQVESTSDLFAGVRVPSRGVWPNGKRPYRIEAITVTRGLLTISVVPL